MLGSDLFLDISRFLKAQFSGSKQRFTSFAILGNTAWPAA
ncbi:hypothetical protein N008_07190 [Hymenobacter sp. APR13]|nr:hypothetical protein N008_07190 [Hymenobacter sp. APR13]